MADEDVSLEIMLPLSMREIYDVRDRIYDWVIELQDRYVLILASAIPKA